MADTNAGAPVAIERRASGEAYRERVHVWAKVLTELFRGDVEGAADAVEGGVRWQAVSGGQSAPVIPDAKLERDVLALLRRRADVLAGADPAPLRD